MASADRHRSDVFTSPVILAAEDRLLTAATTCTGPRLEQTAIARVLQHHASGVALAADQCAAMQTIATSGRVVDVLVGPAGSGKTTTLRALRAAWETERGPGSVIGLAPSATAANELAQALGIGCENTAKWLHETTGPGGRRPRTPRWSNCAACARPPPLEVIGSQSRGSTKPSAI